MLAKALMPLAERLDRKFGWQRLPYYVGLATLIGLRERLRQNNLYSTGVPGVDRPQPPGAREARQTDGSFNDLSQPGMGTAGAPFGRNGPALPDPDPLGAPRPRDVSDALMDRTRFLPASHLSVLAAAWLQFEVHDWMSHAKEPPIGDWLLDADMPLPKAIPTGADPQAFVCREPHWWDASQLYGTHPEYIAEIEREHGEIAVDDDLLRALERQAANFNAPEASLWVGLAALHDPVRARAQRDRPPPARRVPRAGRAVAVREGAADQLGADGQDPHRRVDARDHRPPDDGGRDQGHWWGLRGTSIGAHSRHEGQSPRCAVRADRGVRDGLPAAPAAARRLRARRPDPEPARARRPARERRPAARAHRGGGRERRRAVRAGHAAARPDRAVQLPDDHAPLGADRRPAADRPRRGRHPALTRDRRAALHRVPPAPAPAACRRRSRSSPAATRTPRPRSASVYGGNLEPSTPSSACTPSPSRGASRSARPRSGSSC